MTAKSRGSEPRSRYPLAEALEILDTSPGWVEVATAGVPTQALHEPLEPGGWSARDILAHVRACDRTWGGYIELILDEDQPSFRAESPRSTIHQTDFLEQPFAASLEAFTSDRARLMARLRLADVSDFAHDAMVSIPGLGQQRRSAGYYADRMAVHERDHVRQIERAVGSPRGRGART